MIARHSDTMRADIQFHNIENTSHRGGHRFIGWTRSERVFRVAVAPMRSAHERWFATAITPREGAVNELRGPTLASISSQLDALEA